MGWLETMSEPSKIEKGQFLSLPSPEGEALPGICWALAVLEPGAHLGLAPRRVILVGHGHVICDGSQGSSGVGMEACTWRRQRKGGEGLVCLGRGMWVGIDFIRELGWQRW